MKTFIFSLTAFAALTSSSFGQIFFNDDSGTTYDTEINGAPNTTQDLNLELLYGTTSTTVASPVVTLLLSSTQTVASGNQPGQTISAAYDISAFGTIFDNSGTEYVLGPDYYSQTLYFQVLAWTDNYSSYTAALNSGNENVAVGASQVFTETLPPALTYPGADISNVGVISLTTPTGTSFAPETVIPEPSPLAMSGAALGFIALFMRRKILPRN